VYELLKKANVIRKKDGSVNLFKRGGLFIHNRVRHSVVKNISSLYSVQKLIEKLLIDLEYIQGIGSGWHVEISGESDLVERFSNLDGHKTVIDVGAHQGEFTDLVLARLNDVTIHQFEPQESCAGVLKEKYEHNNKVIMNEFALSYKEGQGTIYYTEEGAGGASLTERELKHSDATVEDNEQVEIDTLDGYASKENIDNIDLLKIDVEGHELDVLKGGRALFNNQKVMVCSFEFGGACIDTRTFLIDYFDFFEKNGYNLYRLTPGGYLYPLPKYRETDEKFRTTIFVVISDSVRNDLVN
jgi:FkbM family methyltransferase